MNAGQDKVLRPSKTARVSSALKSGVVYGGSAVLTAVNNITPHIAGAVDILVVEQPDGSRKATPFYVRFGKYQPLRTKERQVKLYVNDELAPFCMHLGTYGQAYFAAEVAEVDEADVDGQDALLAGMMSPPSGYSSGPDEPDAAGEVLSAVRQEVNKITVAKKKKARIPHPALASADDAPGLLVNLKAASVPLVPTQEQPIAASLHAPSARLPHDPALTPAVVEPGFAAQQQQQPEQEQAMEYLATLAEPLALLCDAAGGDGGGGAFAAAASSGTFEAPRSSSRLLAAGAGGNVTSPTSAQRRASSHPRLSMADRDDSFMSCRDTLATPMSDDVVAAALEDIASSGAGAEGNSDCRSSTTSIDDVGQAPAAEDAAGADACSPTGRSGSSELSTGASPEGRSPSTAVCEELAQRAHPSRSCGGAVAVPLTASHYRPLGGLADDGVADCPSSGPAAVHSAPAKDGHAPGSSPLQQQVGFPVVAGGSAGAAAAGHGPSHAVSLLSTGLRTSMEQQRRAATAGGLASGETLTPRAPADEGIKLQLSCRADGTIAVRLAVLPPAAAARSASPFGSAIPSQPSSAFASAGPSTLLEATISGCMADGEPIRSTAAARSAALGALLSASAGHGPTAAQRQLQQLLQPPASPSAPPVSLLQGMQLSLCGAHLGRDMPYAQALELFNAHRVSADAYMARGQQICASPDLVVLLNEVLYPWSVVSHCVVGMLAFGSWRVPAGAPCWAPEGVQEAAAAAGVSGKSSSATTTPKKAAQPASAGSSSWRLWPFGTWRGDSLSRSSGATGKSPPGPMSPLAERQASERAGSSRVMPERSSSEENVPAGMEAAAQLPGSVTSPRAAPANGATEGGADGSSLQQQPPSRRNSRSASQSGAKYTVITKKTLAPLPEQLAALPLKLGQNTITYRIGTTELKAYVYYLHWQTKIVISDVDGTITRSDVLGHLLPAMGLDWSHRGIAKLLTDIRQNNYLVMYLSSRSISQANITRDFINTLVQGEHRMPLGPVIISPHGLLPSLYREMILRRPHEFKIATLQDIRALFPPAWNPFYAGFGNRDTDEVSYREVGMLPSRIFIINPRGELRQAAPANGAKAAEPGSPADQQQAAAPAQPGAMALSLAAINDLVHDIFPPVSPRPITGVDIDADLAKALDIVQGLVAAAPAAPSSSGAEPFVPAGAGARRAAAARRAEPFDPDQDLRLVFGVASVLADQVELDVVDASTRMRPAAVGAGSRGAEPAAPLDGEDSAEFEDAVSFGVLNPEAARRLKVSGLVAMAAAPHPYRGLSGQASAATASADAAQQPHPTAAGTSSPPTEGQDVPGAAQVLPAGAAATAGATDGLGLAQTHGTGTGAVQQHGATAADEGGLSLPEGVANLAGAVEEHVSREVEAVATKLREAPEERSRV